jgi:glutamate N-acetyltransferase/amino-acid N-acetyltransferase
MIRPDMATMLCFITSDVAISHDCLKRCLHNGVDTTFNSITVDGDTSTNDTVIVMTNGLAGNKPVRSTGSDFEKFQRALTEVMLRLAKMIVGDGERITRVVSIHVRGAASSNDARKAAEAVANSTLVKCSWFGGDPNWGRVIHAVGYSGARMREEYVDIYFDGKLACKNGLAASTPLSELTPIAARREFTVAIDLNMGSAETTVYTTDLTPEYVTFNSSEYAAAKRKQPLA